ncbi:hypothetical protein IMZ48_42545 [Candidatus Bathyarchaeota archaeon]|nr:hypothetical protein [Candidatus Bathyarchaeota archaeon]
MKRTSRRERIASLSARLVTSGLLAARKQSGWSMKRRTFFPPARSSSTAPLISRVTSSSFADRRTRLPGGGASADGRKREVRPSTKVKLEARVAMSRSRPCCSPR